METAVVAWKRAMLTMRERTTVEAENFMME
jgi:hypothetical protein